MPRTVPASRARLRPCPVCGEMFLGQGRRYCSLRCRMDFYATQRREERHASRPASGICRQCGDTFDQPPPGQKQLLYCTAACRTRWHRAKQFPRGHQLLSRVDREAMEIVQGGLCAICRQPERAETADGKKFRLAVDHDALTNNVRGLLCSRCNIGLGSFGDDPRRLVAAAIYLADQLTQYDRVAVLRCLARVLDDADPTSRTNVPFSAPGPGHEVPVGPGGKPNEEPSGTATNGPTGPSVAPHSHAPDGLPVPLPKTTNVPGTVKPKVDPKAAGRAGGGNRNGGGAAPGSGAGQPPRRGRPSSK